MTDKGKYVKDIQAGEVVRGIFLVGGFKLNPYRNKHGQFLTYIMSDRTGTIEAKTWEWPDGADIPVEGCIIKCEGKAVEYAGNIEVHVGKLSQVDGGIVNQADFLPSSPVPIEQMLADLENMVSQIKNQSLKALLTNFMQDQTLFERFCRAPAAKLIHQAYMGGLLEHSLQTARIASMVAELYPLADKDLVVAGALLHDIGKLVEYSYDLTIDFTDEGRLLGHIVLGLDLLDSLVAGVEEFPKKLHLALRHIITSHHGKYEWQSPKKPKIIEACLIHYADAIEADMWKFSMLKEKHGNQGWSPYQRSLERYIYLEDML